MVPLCSVHVQYCLWWNVKVASGNEIPVIWGKLGVCAFVLYSPVRHMLKATNCMWIFPWRKLCCRHPVINPVLS